MNRVPSEQFAWVPDDVNVELPSAARVYDYLLGGGHNFAADRAVGEKVLRALPNGRQIASSNRAFLRRAVLHMVDQGITQFLDLGSGIPTVGNVHEVAQAADPMCRVVYVDNDEVAVAHSQLILEATTTPPWSPPTSASRRQCSTRPPCSGSSTSVSLSA